MGVQALSDLHQLGHDVGRRGPVRVAHAHVDHVLAAATCGHLQLGGDVEDVGRQALDAGEIHGWAGVSGIPPRTDWPENQKSVILTKPATPGNSAPAGNHDSPWIMTLHLDNTAGINLITGYGADHVLINKVRHEGNLVVLAQSLLPGWAPGGFAGLTLADFEAILPLKPEILLIGTGRRQSFPNPALLRPLIETRIGFEVMDLAAACRTYNILVSESRAVAAALLFDPAP